MRVLALDFGGTKVMGGIVDSSGKILYKRTAATDISGGPEGFLLWLASFGREIIAESKAGGKTIGSIGITVPGLADSGKGTMVYGPHTGWRDVPFGAVIGEEFRLPVRVQNDVNACALAEMRFGCARGIGDFIWITVSTGIGGGIVVNGSLYEGSSGIAGEFGHLSVADDGPKCDCGSYGCVEALASGTAVARRARELQETGAAFVDLKPSEISAEIVAKAAFDGDAAALAIYEDAGFYLGKAISFAINILNPAMVIIGGGVARSASLFMPALRAAMEPRVISRANKRVPVAVTALGYEAGLMGAAAIALDACPV